MRRLSEYIADALGMPKDVVMDLPKVSVCGDREIFVENHKGLVEYTDKEIRLKMKDGMIRVKGSGLRIIVMEYDRMVINGVFEGVFYD